MRSFVIPAAVAAVLAATPFAFASQTATGTVKTFNPTAHILALQDGTVYTLPMVFKDPGLRSGTKVSVIWEMKNGKLYADEVMIQK